MVKRKIDRIAYRTRIGFIAAFLLLLVSYVLTYISTQKVMEQTRWITHTNEVIHDLDNILGFITRAESSFRGYVIGKDTALLGNFDESVEDIDSTFQLVRVLISDNPEQEKNSDTLLLRVQGSLNSIEHRMSIYSQKKVITPELVEQSVSGNLLMAKVQDQVQKMQDTERAALVKRSSNISSYSDLINIFNVISIVIAVLLTLYSVLIFNKENKAKKEQSRKAVVFREELENRVKQLADLNKELLELRSQEKYAVTGRIARSIAHEVRNPLTNINLALEQLSSEFEGNGSSKMFFEMISRNSERINNLVSDLLNSTRLQDIQAKDISINQILDASLAEAADRIKLNNIQVIKNFDSEMCPVSVDFQKVKTAFLNLIVNAIEAMGEGGKLYLSTETENEKCVVKIRDTGKGMSREQLGQLFEPFVTTKPKGNGLGLANTQNIILSHNGSISAESEEGKGTTMIVKFNFS